MPRPLATLARLLAAPSPGSLVADFYRYADPIFECVTQGSGMIDIGWAADPATADLAEAQRDLIRLATARGRTDGRWLETGSGWGGPAVLLAREHPGLRITGLDISPDHVAAARALAAREGLADRVQHVLGDAQAMPFPDATFDAVLAVETAFHYPDKVAFAHEAARVVVRGGSVAIVDFVLRPERARWWERLAIVPNQRLGAMGGLLTGEAWCRLLADAGFVDVESRDLTPGSIGLLGRWADRMDAQAAALRTRYPRPLLAYYGFGLRRMAARAERSAVGYVLLQARKP